MKKFQSRRLAFEALENRQMLAGGAVAQVTNLSVPQLDILPGGQNKVLAGLKISTFGRQYARIVEVLVVPAAGSELLAWNARGFELKADLNRKAKDGCEATIAYGRADYGTDLVSFNITRAVWINPKATLRAQIVADFPSWGFSGEAIGVDVAEVAFRDLRNREIPEERVVYNGADPVLHIMEDEMFSIWQDPIEPVGSVLTGQAGVSLIQFGTGKTENVLPGSVTFVAGQGSLANANNYSLLADYNWDGAWDSISAVAAVSNSGELMFAFPEEAASRDSVFYEVRADIVDVLPVNPRIQLVFTADGSGITATDAETGKLLRGVIVNGGGEGQIRLYQSPQYSPVYSITQDPELFVKEVGGDPEYVYAPPGTQGIVVDTFMAYSDNDFVVNYVAISAADGNLDYLEDIVLWWDSNNDGIDDSSVKSKMVGSGAARQAVFEGFSASGNGGQSLLFKVHAAVRQDVPQWAGVRARLTALGGSRSTGEPLPNDKVFLELSRQTYFYFYEGGLG